MTHYSSPEAETRAQNIILSLQAKLEGVGIKSEKTQNWYWFSLNVTEDPEVYRAMTVTEGVDKGVLVVSFDTIRMEPDGEILYRGLALQENLEDFDQEVYDEAIKQNSWVKRMHERRALDEAQRQAVQAALGRLRKDFPEYADSIHPTSTTECNFGLRLQGLSEARVRAIITLVGALPEEKSNA
jgi:hypothetical protein